MKGISLEVATVVVLALDGTLVYVESVQPTFVGVVALPDQPVERADERVFTPGRVGAKKISPFSVADKIVAIADLSDRNKTFIGTYEQLRLAHGPNHVDRTPEEEAALAAANAPKPARSAKPRLTPEEKAAKKGPRFLQRCVTCGEQAGHPNHPAQHAFEAPAPPAVLCAACDELESADVHTKDKAAGGHKFIAAAPIKAVRVPKPDKPAREPKPGKPSKTGVDPAQVYRWVGNEATYELLVSVNPKFSAKNSGGAIVEALKAAPTGIAINGVLAVLAMHPRWGAVPVDRLQLAFGQMLSAKLIEAC